MIRAVNATLLLLQLSHPSSAYCPSHLYRAPSQLGNKGIQPPLPHLRQTTFLSARRDDASTSTSPKSFTGVYVRPSAAIERGSGFFIPGLEGPRVRLLFGLILIMLTVINHPLLGDDHAIIGESSLSESLAIGYAVLLLLQAAIEFGKEERGFVVSLPSASGDATSSLLQRWGSEVTSSMSSQWKSRVQWSAASYLSLTPATDMLLLDNDHILYYLGASHSPEELDSKSQALGCKAAMETLALSKSGRLSLPLTHPAATALAPKDARCIVLQVVCKNQCLMMTSNQLLQSFTSDDLKWLGRIAIYIEQNQL